MNPTPLSALSSIIEQINGCLVEVFQKKTVEEQKTAPGSEDLLAAVGEFARRGGKRLRGVLVILGHRALSPEPPALYPVAVAVELFHAYLLVHDDIIDGDRIRRGGPTLHVRLAEAVSDEALGRSLAMLGGDLLCAWAMQLMLDYPKPEAALRIARELSHAHSRVVVGQRLDLLPPEALDPVIFSRMHDLKTGEYSFLLPLRIGGLVAGADEEVLHAFSSYALHVGRAFQAKDDLLDAFGQEEKTGKRIGTDILEGRRTWLVNDVLSHAPKAAQELTLLLEEGPSDVIARVQQIFEESGAKRRCEEFIRKQIQSAQSTLEKAPIDREARALLQYLASFVAEREV